MLMTLISMLGGGLLRLAPEVFSFLNKGKDYAHELAMLDKQIEIAKSKAADDRETAQVQGNIAEVAALLHAQETALTGQMQMTGVKWADALNILVRPMTTYYFLGIHGLVKFATLQVAMRQLDTWTAIKGCWTADDAAILSGILAFWFVGRVFEKQR